MDTNPATTTSSDTAPKPQATTVRPAWYRFTLREILLAMVALGALLGWYINSPRAGSQQTQFFVGFNPDVHLRSAGKVIRGVSYSGNSDLTQRIILLEGKEDLAEVMRILRKRVRTALADEPQLVLRGESAGGGGHPGFTFRYRQGRISGVVVCRTFPAEREDDWQLFFLVHEVSHGW